MAPQKIDWRSVNPMTDFQFGDQKVTAQSASIRVTCRDPATGNYLPLLFQGPKLRVPFGCEPLQVKDTDELKYYCSMAFPGVHYSPKEGETYGNGIENTFVGGGDNKDVIDFFRFWQAVDQTLCQRGAENAQHWFKKKISKEVISEFYHPCIKYGNEEEAAKYGPKLNAKLHVVKGEVRSSFWNSLREQIRISDVSRGDTVVPVISSRGLWFAGKQFGMALKVEQVMVFKAYDDLKDCAIDFEEEEDRAAYKRHLEAVEEEHEAKKAKPGAVSCDFEMPEQEASVV